MSRPTHWLGRIARQVHRVGGHTCCKSTDDNRSLSSQGSSPEIVEVQVRMPVAFETSTPRKSEEEAL